MTPKEKSLISADRMKYIKNTASSRLCYLAIALDVLYFINLYETDKNFYYQLLLGVSVVYNLLFMLFVFLASEGVKKYRPGYSVLLFAAGAAQVARIFILPLSAYETFVKAGERAMEAPQFARAAVWLVLSAVCLVAAGAVNTAKYRKLEAARSWQPELSEREED